VSSDGLFELNCADHRIPGARFAPGLRFSCWLGPVSENTVAALNNAIRRQTCVRLMFTGEHVLLLPETIKRKRPQRVHLVGHVIQIRPVKR
jgi:hypothetical protein